MKEINVQNLEKKSDERGWLVEAIRGEWLAPHNQFGQMHISVANPGKVRGNHYHTRKVEWFCVPTGSGLLKLKNRTTGEEEELAMGENDLKTVKITPNIIHAIKNIGEKEMVLLVYSNESFDPADPDTFYEKILE